MIKPRNWKLKGGGGRKERGKIGEEKIERAKWEKEKGEERERAMIVRGKEGNERGKEGRGNGSDWEKGKRVEVEAEDR